jgi:hypothetical protein
MTITTPLEFSARRRAHKLLIRAGLRAQALGAARLAAKLYHGGCSAAAAAHIAAQAVRAEAAHGRSSAA